MIGICATFLTASLAFAGSSQSRQLLDCNTPIGPDQQVMVVKNGDALILRELSLSGSLHERVLSQDEWKSGGLKLTGQNDGTETTLSASPQGWWLESNNPITGYKESAPADCAP